MKKRKKKKAILYLSDVNRQLSSSSLHPGTGTGKITLNGYRIITISQVKDKIYSLRKIENLK
jgi:hypothetical protein